MAGRKAFDKIWDFLNKSLKKGDGRLNGHWTILIFYSTYLIPGFLFLPYIFTSGTSGIRTAQGPARTAATKQ
jgi:hypothetical protein